MTSSYELSGQQLPSLQAADPAADVAVPVLGNPDMHVRANV